MKNFSKTIQKTLEKDFTTCSTCTSRKWGGTVDIETSTNHI